MLRLLVIFFLLISAFLTFPYFALSLIQTEEKATLAMHDSALVSLAKVIDVELENAVKQIEKNHISSKEDKSKLIADLNNIWSEIKGKGFFMKTGSDRELRSGIVGMQAIIEKSIAIALADKRLESAEAFIVAPRMASSLLIAKGKSFSQIDFSKQKAFAELRRMTLETYLSANGRLNTVYPLNALQELADQKQSLEIFHSTVKNFEKNLKDLPVLKMDTKAFPLEKAGAIYFLDNDAKNAIAIRSFQIAQVGFDKKAASTWEISFGASAAERVKEINKFFKDNDQAHLVR